MNSPKADAQFFLGMVQRGRLTPEKALADLGTPKKLELVLAGYAAKDPKLGQEILKMVEHRRLAVEELTTHSPRSRKRKSYMIMVDCED